MVALFVCGNYAIYSAFAEEPAEPVNEQTAETETETEVKDLKAQVAEIVAAYNTWKDDNYFANNILPILLGVGSTLIGFIGCAVPWIRTHAKYKQLQGAYAALIDQTDNLKKLLSSTDPAEVQKALSALVSDELKRQINDVVAKIKVDYGALGEVKGQLQTLLAQVKALSDAAKVTWHVSPQAVALLSAAPTQAAVDNIAAENAKLKAYIREQNDKGDEVINEIIAG